MASLRPQYIMTKHILMVVGVLYIYTYRIHDGLLAFGFLIC